MAMKSSKPTPAAKKKPGNAAEDRRDGGKDDAQEMPMKKSAPKAGAPKKGAVPPQFLKARGAKKK